jgi:DNA-directed RNA polymerase III subunit RPC1
VKKTGVLRIVHERYKGRAAEELSAEFQQEFDEAQRHNKVEEETQEKKKAFVEMTLPLKELRPHLSKAQEDLSPLRTLQLFRRVPAEDCELLDLKPHGVRKNKHFF